MKKGNSITKGEREKAWDFALGLIQIDGLTPTKEFLDLVEKEKNGTITTDDIRRVLTQKYHMKTETGSLNA